jgi:hypothetical protein
MLTQLAGLFKPSKVRDLSPSRTWFRQALREELGEFTRGDEFRHGVRAELDRMAGDDKFRTAVIKAVQDVAYPVLRDPNFLMLDFPKAATRVDKGTQILLSLKYQELLRTGAPLPKFDEVGFRTFSQFDEDGILLYIFSLIGTTNRKCVEACAGVGYECNSANLIANHGWHGLLFDGNKSNTDAAKHFYAGLSDTQITIPKIVNAWLDTTSIDRLIKENGFEGEIDLMTIDLDGVDYWIWKSIKCVRPRVVVAEYQQWWGPDEPYTVKNKPGFCYWDHAETMPAYCGAGLAAFVNLGRELGYRLVGCNRNQLNAFFVRDGIGEKALPEVSAASCLTHPRVTEMRTNYRKVVEGQLAKGEWVRV